MGIANEGTPVRFRSPAIVSSAANTIPETQSDRAFWAIVAWALGVRLMAALWSDFYVDEGFSYFLERSPVGQLIRSCRVDAHPPLFYLLTAPLAWLTREPFWLRLPNVLLSVASLWFLNQLCQRVGLERRGRLAVCALQASSYLVWSCETEFRSNALFELLNLMQVWALVEPGVWAGFPYRCAALMLPLTNLLGNITALGAAWDTRRQGIRVWVWPCLGLLLSAVWLVYSQTGSASALRESRFRGGAGAGLDLPEAFLGLSLVLHWPWWRTVAWSPVCGRACALLGWLLLARGARDLWRQGRGGRWTVLAFAVPFLCLTGLGLVRGGGWFQARYMVPYAPFFFILIVQGCRSPGWRPACVLIPVLAAQVFTACLFPGDSYWWNQSWQPFAQFVGGGWHEGDKLVVYHPYSLNGFDFYYNRGRVQLQYDGPVSRIDQPPGPLWLEQLPVVPEALGPGLAGRRGSSRVFLLLSQENDSRVRDWFSQRYDIVAYRVHEGVQSWGHCECYLLTPKR